MIPITHPFRKVREKDGAPGDSIAGHFSKSVRSGAPPLCFGQCSKAKPRYTFPVMWHTRQRVVGLIELSEGI
jgi:hypothetical protein